MTPIMVDTDVLIWFLRGKPQAIHWLQAAAGRGRLTYSALTVSEVFRLVRTEELRKTEALVAGLDVMAVTYPDARRAADLMRDRGPGFVDCHIAATALRLDAPVMTYNRRDFARTGVRLVDPLELGGWALTCSLAMPASPPPIKR